MESEKFALIRDFEIIKSFSLNDQSIVCGGVADYIHINKLKIDKEFYFNDLDLMVTNTLIDNISDSNRQLDELIKSRKFPCCSFNFDGTVTDVPNNAVHFDDSKYKHYPRQIKAFIKNKPIDIFVGPWETRKFLEVKIFGTKIKITTLEERIKMIQSILNKKFMNYKKNKFEAKLNLLLNAK